MSMHPEQPDRSTLPGREAASVDALRQLEHATSPVTRLSIATDARDPTSDAETAALRESWLALSHLLDSNTPSVDEAALLSQVRHRVGRQVKRRRWQGAGLVLAASLLLTVGIAWLVTRSSNPQMPDNANAPIARTPQIETSSEPPQFVSVEPDLLDSSDINIADAYWQDDLADDLAQTQQDLANIRTNWSGRPDRIAWMQFQLNEFEHELGDSSL